MNSYQENQENQENQEKNVFDKAKDLATAPFKPVAEAVKSVMETLRNETDKRTTLFKEPISKADPDKVLRHNLILNAMQYGTILGCVGLGCLAYVAVNKNPA